MKQTKLVIKVYDEDMQLCFTVDPATIDNVRSCIDLWHKPGSHITLDFEEFEVESNSISNN